MQHFVASYATPDAFLEAFDLEMLNGGLLVRGAQPEPGQVACEVELRLGGTVLGTVHGEVAIVRRTGVAVEFADLPPELVAVAERLRSGGALALVPAAPEPAPVPAPAAEPRGTVAERIAALTVPQKIQLALSGDREQRIALLRDHNKVLHAYVLKNPRIGLDEVTFAAKLTSLAPDALKAIAENAEWGQNQQICIAVARNTGTPTPVALRLLPRLPTNEVRAIAKGGARDALVQFARKMLAG